MILPPGFSPTFPLSKACRYPLSSWHSWFPLPPSSSPKVFYIPSLGVHLSVLSPPRTSPVADEYFSLSSSFEYYASPLSSLPFTWRGFKPRHISFCHRSFSFSTSLFLQPGQLASQSVPIGPPSHVSVPLFERKFFFPDHLCFPLEQFFFQGIEAPPREAP